MRFDAVEVGLASEGLEGKDFWPLVWGGLIAGGEVAEERLLVLLDCELSRSVALVGGDDARGERFCGELSVRGLGDALFVALSDRGRLKAGFGIRLLVIVEEALREDVGGVLEEVITAGLDGCFMAEDLTLASGPFLNLVVPSLVVLTPSSSSSESSMTSDDLNFPFDCAFLFSFFGASLTCTPFNCFVVSPYKVELLSKLPFVSLRGLVFAADFLTLPAGLPWSVSVSVTL